MAQGAMPVGLVPLIKASNSTWGQRSLAKSPPVKTSIKISVSTSSGTVNSFCSPPFISPVTAMMNAVQIAAAASSLSASCTKTPVRRSGV